MANENIGDFPSSESISVNDCNVEDYPRIPANAVANENIGDFPPPESISVSDCNVEDFPHIPANAVVDHIDVGNVPHSMPVSVNDCNHSNVGDFPHSEPISVIDCNSPHKRQMCLISSVYNCDCSQRASHEIREMQIKDDA